MRDRHSDHLAVRTSKAKTGEIKKKLKKKNHRSWPIDCRHLDQLAGRSTSAKIGIVNFFFQSLSHCELITDEGIRSVGVSPCSVEHLSVSELDNCPLITDAALDNLISCHSLQRTKLYDCQLVTQAGISRPKVTLISFISLFKIKLVIIKIFQINLFKIN